MSRYLKVKYFPKSLYKFGVELLRSKRLDHSDKSSVNQSSKELKSVPYAFPGDVIEVVEPGPRKSANIEPRCEIRMRESSYRHGLKAAHCAISGLACHRCPWREMSIEAQLRFKIKAFSEFIFDVLRTSQDSTLETFRIENIDSPEVGRDVSPFHTLYFGSSERSTGVIFQKNVGTPTKIEKIHSQCRLMDQETREVISALNDWWSKERNLPGWDSAIQPTKSKLLSVTVHHLKRAGTLVIRLHATGTGPNEYILCNAEHSTSFESTAESNLVDMVNEKLLAIGYTGEVHLSVLVLNPSYERTHLKVLIGAKETFDRVPMADRHILVPFRMCAPSVAYDRHPDQHFALCRSLIAHMLQHRHRTVAHIDERGFLQCSVAYVSLALCKFLPSLIHMVHPTFLQSGACAISLQSRTVSIPDRQRREIQQVCKENGVSEGTVRESFDPHSPLDAAIIGYTNSIFQDATESTSEITTKLLRASTIYILSSNFSETSEFRYALSFFLQNGFKLSAAQLTSRFHATSTGGFVQLVKA